MSKEFYNYIAKRIISYFGLEESNIHDGDRFCLRLDNDELVREVNNALKEKSSAEDIQGRFSYLDKYSTYTIKLANKEIIVAAQIDGMTNDFFGTLRNIPLSVNRNPILMIQCAPNDTIASASRDLSAKGMPFHSEELFKSIEDSLNSAHLSSTDLVLLRHELERKKADRFADKKSIYEYKSLLTAIYAARVSDENWFEFRLLPDDLSLLSDEKKQTERIDSNHEDFGTIDRAYRFGNIREALQSEYDSSFITELEKKKRKNEPWYSGLGYTRVLQSKANKKRKDDSPLDIQNNNISVFYNSPLEYEFVQDELFFVRNAGETKARQRDKSILIYNPEGKTNIVFHVQSNISLGKDMIKLKDKDITNFKIQSNKKEVDFVISCSGCTFSHIEISDPVNKISFKFRLCILNLSPEFFPDLQTCFRVDGTGAKRRLLGEGIKDRFVVNPGSNHINNAILEDQGSYSFSVDTRLELTIPEECISPDTGKVLFSLSCGGIQIPMSISDETVKPQVITGVGAFKRKNELHHGFVYRDGKIILGTSSFFARGQFSEDLEKEAFFVDNMAMCVQEDKNGFSAVQLDLPEDIAISYMDLVRALKEKKQLPSLAFLDDDFKKRAEAYVDSVNRFFSSLATGQVLTKQYNDTLKLGVFIDQTTGTIAFSPLHPLNVLYQLRLQKESGLGTVRDEAVERLTSGNLVPYIRSEQSNELLEIVEQKTSPEWRYYAPLTNKRFHGARDFVPKLVSEKIEEYYAHFKFLFKDLGENRLIINLHNLGDCKEVLQGIIRYYKKRLGENALPEDIISFEINIYGSWHKYSQSNDFSVLSNLKKTREYLEAIDDKYEGNADLATLLVSKTKYFIHRDGTADYKYCHIAFYEMVTSDNTGDSKISGLTTGASLDGLVSGVPSVLNSGWYKTGFGSKYAPSEEPLIQFASVLNSIYRIAFSSSTYMPDQCITTEVRKDSTAELNNVYSASNWVVFVDPKVDLSFFYQDETSRDLLIIHYGDQNSSASGYNAITVTKKSEQYEKIISQELLKRNVHADVASAKKIIDFFNAVNGRWLLRLISSKRALESTFSREKMSIISAIKFAMAYYAHDQIVWIPISLEELLRVSGNTGLSRNEGILSAKNLGFAPGATCDDLLLVGIEKKQDGLRVYLHPIEVKIGQNQAGVIEKAKAQAQNTYVGLHNALWPDGEERNQIERKVVRNFVMQLAILSCEKMKLYGIYPEETWNLVLDDYRQDLLNENYQISEEISQLIGKATVLSFKQDEALISGAIDSEGIAIIHLPEKPGYEYLVKTVSEVEREVEKAHMIPAKLSRTYSHADPTVPADSGPVSSQQLEIPTQPDAAPVVADHEVGEQQNSRVTGELSPEQERPPEKDRPEPINEVDDTEVTPLVAERKGMEILFGSDITNGKELIWLPNDTEQVFHTNTGIIGTMGTGKTQFTKSIITQLYRDQSHNFDGSPLGILIFDYKGDYNESKEDFVKATNAKVLKPYHLPFNPLALTKSKVFKPLLPIHTANAFKDTLSKVYGLGPKQQNTLFTCITKAYAANGIVPGDASTWNNVPPTFSMVYQLYIGDDEIKKNDTLAAAMEKLQQFEVFESDPQKTVSLFSLLNGVVVVDLSGYDSDIQSLIVAITLDLFYSQMQAAGSSKMDQQYRQLTKLILVDEADNFMSEGFPALKKILKEGREFGVGTILSTQFLKHFGASDDDYAKYILTWVVHNVADLKQSDVEYVFKAEAKSNETQRLFNDIKGLQKHHSIVKIGTAKPKYIKDKAFWELYKELHLD